MAAITACLYVSLPEWRGRPRSRGFLLLPPVLAFICAYVMMGFVAAENREPWLLRGALAAGLVLGVIRGYFVRPEVDEFGLVRLPGADAGVAGRADRDGVQPALAEPALGQLAQDRPQPAVEVRARHQCRDGPDDHRLRRELVDLEADLGQLNADPRWKVSQPGDTQAWTDDYSNIIAALLRRM